MARRASGGVKSATAARNKALAAIQPDENTPPPLRELLGFQLRRAHMLFALHWQLSFRDQPVAITPVQGGMLLLIGHQPGLSQVALARLMDVEGPTLVQAIDRLEESGLVDRLRRVDDRRSYALSLTPAGQAVLAAVESFVPHREAELLVDLSAEERVTLLDLLQRVVRRSHVVLDDLAARTVSARAQAAPAAARPGVRRS